MNDEADTALRKVLDTMERTHKRIFAVGWLSVAATLAAYIWLDHVERTAPVEIRRLISAAVLALTCLIAWASFALAVVITRMGRRILLAIELTANRPDESGLD